ncbi:glutamate-cysteine ligase family protein [Streptomyces sp. NPDC048340]|uniref:glutamate-cysteine ligase family protein n=1 Tax=Streptomyces sp. NPDC048340 TaxID=3365537 RepID=UPI00371CAB42
MDATELPGSRPGSGTGPESRPGPAVSTFGVEEEFQLVDRLTRAPVARAEPVIEAASPSLGEQVQREFYGCMVEVCTRPATTRTDLRAQLAALAEAAAESRCLLVASGTAVVPPAEPIPVSDTPRYRRMARRFGACVDGRLGPWSTPAPSWTGG